MGHRSHFASAISSLDLALSPRLSYEHTHRRFIAVGWVMYGVAAASFRVWPACFWEANSKAAAVIVVTVAILHSK